MNTLAVTFTKSDCLPDQSRPPLRPRLLSTKSITNKQVRRKPPFVLRSNSSDDPPSSHNSIYDAPYFSANNSEEANNWTEPVILPESSYNPPETQAYSHRSELPTPCASISKIPAGNNQNSRPNEPSTVDPFIADTQFLYGQGTFLKTITEQNSCTTIRSLERRKSIDDLPKFLKHCDSFILVKSPRRRHSFSLDHLAPIKQSSNDGYTTADGTTLDIIPIHEIYAQPKSPLHAPLPRPQTPPGMPSWTESQNVPSSRRLTHPQPNRFQRFFSLSASGSLLPSHISRADLPTDNLITSAPAARRAPRFRPTRSAYAPINQHPFNNAPLANISISTPSPSTTRLTNTPEADTGRRFGRRVRFTPSTTARDSGINSLHNAMDSTRIITTSPITDTQTTPKSQHRSPEQGCPHRKGRRAALKTLRNSPSNHGTASSNNVYITTSDCASASRLGSVAPSSERIPPSPSNPASDASRRGSIDPPTNIPERSASLPLSGASTAYLMSDVLQGASAEPKINVACWKCQIEKGFEKVDQWWLKSASCLCFVCCGFDIEDDMRLHCGPRSSSGANFCPSPRASTQDVLGPRRVILEANAPI